MRRLQQLEYSKGLLRELKLSLLCKEHLRVQFLWRGDTYGIIFPESWQDTRILAVPCLV